MTFQRYKSALNAVSKAAARGSGAGGHLVEASCSAAAKRPFSLPSAPAATGANHAFWRPACRCPLPRATRPFFPLPQVLFGTRPPRFSPESIGVFKPVNPGLDASQREAVSFALRALDCALVHGPPGTGKTTAVVEIILQSVARGARVLACAASNIATDNLVRCSRPTTPQPPPLPLFLNPPLPTHLPTDPSTHRTHRTHCTHHPKVERLRLGNNKMKLVRMGHPARVLPAVLDVTLEAQVMGSDNSALASDCRKEMKTLSAKLLKLTSRERNERREVRGRRARLACVW